ncbi:TIGR02221 family CRISPR-associated protein [Fervidobacterium thailandense]|uniref:CRISPR-associated DxTHG motif protein n=1 Tax=Fervidobacterium thailandense TaxID=1008305 RepID=A0A1E3G3L0_9BACT|nr:TIGR02221 family CRISPR-associated protein [Fervidobacterium thailandense]ODN30760.1 hypothetical protein A4H02_04335 [Fervidobacterium thailandense]
MGVLVLSFIGKSMFDTAEKNYRHVRYVFQDGTEIEGSFFGQVLIDYLRKKNVRIDKVVLVGERDAAWWVASELVHPLKRSALLGFKVLLNNDRSVEILEQFAKTISQYLDYHLEFEWIDSSVDIAKVQRDIVQKVMKHIDYNVDEIILDISHATRFIPVVALGILLPARYVTVKRIRIFYGHHEFEKEPKPAIELSALEELIQFDEKMAAFHLTGDFSQVACTMLPRQKERVRKMYFSFELNQPSIEEMKFFAQASSNYFYYPVAKTLEKFASAEHLHDVFYQKALFHFEKEQYFKAIPLLFEAILTLLAYKMVGRSVNDYRLKEQVKKLIPKVLGKEDAKNFEKLQQLRNCIVHGTRAKVDIISDYLEDENQLKELFKTCSELYERKRVEEIHISNEKVKKQVASIKRTIEIVEKDQIDLDEIF